MKGLIYMAILEKSALVVVGNTKDTYFESLGYTIPRYTDKQGRLKVKRGTKIEVNIQDLPKNSSIKLTKICDFCGILQDRPQPYQMIIRRRTQQGKDRCENCAKKKSAKTRYEHCPENKSLAFLYPEIAKQFHHHKNNNLKAEELYANSSKLVWWTCPINPDHDYDMSVTAKTNNNAGCPYCAGQRANHTNCLAKSHPFLVMEWDYEMNKDNTPDNVTTGSGKSFWWICPSENCKHRWKARVADRVKGCGCPQCNESKGEKRIREYLMNKNILFQPQYIFNNLTGVGGGLLKFDFAILDHDGKLNCLIEYDGEFHYCKLFEDDNHESIKIHDKLKNMYCKKNNIKLIRIPYWEYDSIEYILDKELDSLFYKNVL